ncbi:MAG: hypothetical protein WB795_03105 [Candidatus Acidiferrales bacterium]
MFFISAFPLLVMYFSLLRILFRLPSCVADSRRSQTPSFARNELMAAPRAMRRSTRIAHPVQIRVTAVDSSRGPYCEVVAADSISCHGLTFKWKYKLPIDSEVMLEVNYGNQQSQPVVARGVVKWLRRPSEPEQNDFFHTAIQLEKPGNIWKVVSPPEDWLPFCPSKYFIPAESKEALVASGFVF